MNPTLRLRFAPSPTGFLHVGGARTALYNWLYARHEGGTLVLRIEDTDSARSSADMVDGILEGMRWLELDWDEGPIFQRERLPLYRDYASRLLQADQGYYCFCDPALLAKNRLKAHLDGREQNSPCGCSELALVDAQKRIVTGQPAAIRFRVRPGRSQFRDLIQGVIDIDHSTLEDFVLLRSDGVPTYHLSVVVDDIEMKISHVVRGADHISNTPKQILIYQALEHHLPQFAHLPLILGPDRKRLSKRHGATSVTAYRDQGILAPAFRNFLALLGWSPGGNREIMDLEEMVRTFSLERVGRSNAVFDLQKLKWLNGKYISKTAATELIPMLRGKMSARDLWAEEFDGDGKDWLLQVVDLVKPRARTLGDLAELTRPFVSDAFSYDPKAVDKYFSSPEVPRLLEKLLQAYRSMNEWNLASAEETLREIARSEQVKAGVLIGALRVSLTGQGVAPGIFDVALTLGREKTLLRIERALRYLRAVPGPQETQRDKAE